MPFPRVLYIRILRDVVSLHLDMGGHMNVIPILTAVIRLLKAADRRLVISRIVELPKPIQAFLKILIACFHIQNRSIIPVVGMCVKPSVAEILRIF